MRTNGRAARALGAAGLVASTFAHADTALLTVRTTPADAEVRIMNIGPKYRPGIELKAREYYSVSVHAPGHYHYREELPLNRDHTLVVDLVPTEVNDARRADTCANYHANMVDAAASALVAGCRSYVDVDEAALVELLGERVEDTERSCLADAADAEREYGYSLVMFMYATISGFREGFETQPFDADYCGRMADSL